MSKGELLACGAMVDCGLLSVLRPEAFKVPVDPEGPEDPVTPEGPEGPEPAEVSNMSRMDDEDLGWGMDCGRKGALSDAKTSNGDDFCCCCCCCVGGEATVGCCCCCCSIGLLFVGANTSNGEDFCTWGAGAGAAVAAGPNRSSGLVLGAGALADTGAGAGTEAAPGPLLNTSKGEVGFVGPAKLLDAGRPRAIGIRSGGCSSGAAVGLLEGAVGAKAPAPLALLAAVPPPVTGALVAYGFTGAALPADGAKASKGLAIVLLPAPDAEGAKLAEDGAGPGKPPNALVPNALPPCAGAKAAGIPWEGANALAVP
jgi:hypothetical protein